MIASTTGGDDGSRDKSIKILPEHWPEREDSKFEDTVEDTKILLLFSLSATRRLDDDDALLLLVQCMKVQSEWLHPPAGWLLERRRCFAVPSALFSTII